MSLRLARFLVINDLIQKAADFQVIILASLLKLLAWKVRQALASANHFGQCLVSAKFKTALCQFWCSNLFSNLDLVSLFSKV